jgi:hypothetical protein
MARDLVQIEFPAQKFHARPFRKLPGGRNRFDLQIHAESPEESPVGKHLLRDRVHGHRASMEPCHGSRIPDMVKVAMGKYQKGDGFIPESFGRTLRCINQKISLRAPDQVGIGLQGPSGEHYGTLGCLIIVHFIMFAFPMALCNGSLS